MSSKFSLNVSIALLLISGVPLVSAQEEEAEPLMPRATPWVREPQSAPDPEATATPFAPTRPVFKRRRSAEQIVTPEREPEELAREREQDKGQAELDQVFGQ